MKGGNLGPMTLIVAVMASALGVIQLKHRNQSLASEIDKLRHDQQQLDQEWSQLQLEQATLAQHGRVDQLARSQFGMIEPLQSVITGQSPAGYAANGSLLPQASAASYGSASAYAAPATPAPVAMPKSSAPHSAKSQADKHASTAAQVVASKAPSQSGVAHATALSPVALKRAPVNATTLTAADATARGGLPPANSQGVR